MFGTGLILFGALMHLYVFWRVTTVPFVSRRIPKKYVFLFATILFAFFVTGREIGHGGEGYLAVVLELIGMNWLASLFLIFAVLLITDLVTGFGLLLPRSAPSLRGLAIVLGCLLALIAQVQGLRPPVVHDFELFLPGLTPALDGTVVAVLSDLHLGSLIDERWLEARLDQVRSLRPDLVLLLGDIVEGHGRDPFDFLPAFEGLAAPMGVWAVQGNHDSRSGIDMMEQAGVRFLRNASVEPRHGLVLTGADYIRGRPHEEDPTRVEKILAERPPGFSIYLSHKPQGVEAAAKAGADLMLCGHTHGGQIWPFGYLVRFTTPFVEGHYEVDGMDLIVSRGAGTWGPRMRLWNPGEILRLVLRPAADRAEGSAS